MEKWKSTLSLVFHLIQSFDNTGIGKEQARMMGHMDICGDEVVGKGFIRWVAMQCANLVEA